jgi:branched-chain amino acid transport system substrate-binding protein
MTMRARLALLLVLVAATVLAASPASAQTGPIKIGFLAPLTGGAAQIGRDTVNGFEMYLAEAGNQIAGRKVELIVEDTAGNPATAITKMRKLVESDKVHIVMGEVFAHIGYALAAKADEYQIPTIFPVIAADDLTQRKPSKWVVRLGWTSSQPSHPFGEYVAKTLGYKKIAVLGSDYAFGYEVVGGFQKTLEEHGGQIIQKLWAPLHRRPRAYVTHQARPTAFVVVVAPQSSPQYQDAGLRRSSRHQGAVITDEPSCHLNDWRESSALQYSAAIDTRNGASSPSTAALAKCRPLWNLLHERTLVQRRRSWWAAGGGRADRRVPGGSQPTRPQMAPTATRQNIVRKLGGRASS